jgi:sugar-specific transcriptional regulator TrmB
MLHKYQKQLEEFGLNTKEANVYVALLQHGAAPASVVANRVELNRSTTYVQLKSLLAYGLISTFKDGKKTFFSAESPLNLERLLEQRISTLEQKKSQIELFLPGLLDSFSQHSIKPIIRNFQGKDGLAAMRNEVFTSADAKIRIITNYDDLLKTFSKKELQYYSAQRKQQSTASYVLYTMAGGDDFTPFEYQRLQRVTTKSKPFGCDVYIYGNTVSFAAMKHEVVGVSIDQADIAATMKTLFDTYWDNRQKKKK